MILFGSTLSPYVRKVAVYAQEKGLSLELKPAGLGQGGPDFEAASPFGKMPGFKDDDFLISDSSAIITYLEAKYPEPNLIPLEPRARARTIWYEELADTIVMAAGVPIFFNRFVKPRFFKLDPDIFECAPEIPAGVLRKVVQMRKENDPEAQTTALLEVLDIVMVPDSATRYADRMLDPTNPISIRDIANTFNWIMEEYAARPTELSVTSSPSPMSTGTTSTDGARPVPLSL